MKEADKSANTTHITLHISLWTGIIGIAGIFIWFGMGALVLLVFVVMVIVFLLNFTLYSLGKRATRSFDVKKWTVRAGSILLAVITFFVTVCGFLYLVQDAMVFYNVDAPISREFLQGKPGFIEVEFTGGNGKTYHGMMYQANNEKAPLLIYFGGNGEVSYSHFRYREEQELWAYLAGYNYLFVDYEGYGLNDGHTGYLNMYEESLEVFDYAAALPGVDSGRIVTMGYSLGTGSAVYLAANRPAAGLILEAPYAGGIDLYNNMFPIFYGPMKWLVKQKLPSDEYAGKIICPVLAIASRSDEVVPFSSSQRLAKLFSGGVDFVQLENEYHNEIFSAPGVFDKIKQFLEEAASNGQKALMRYFTKQ